MVMFQVRSKSYLEPRFPFCRLKKSLNLVEARRGDCISGRCSKVEPFFIGYPISKTGIQPNVPGTGIQFEIGSLIIGA
jgi:hypothetical protein